MSSEYQSLFERDDVDFVVVANGDGKLSIWPASRALPAGWRAIGEAAPRSTCLARIEAGVPVSPHEETAS
jgi:uncharacterized protein YbdZ (MbtH family)